VYLCGLVHGVDRIFESKFLNITPLSSFQNFQMLKRPLMCFASFFVLRIDLLEFMNSVPKSATAFLIIMIRIGPKILRF